MGQAEFFDLNETQEEPGAFSWDVGTNVLYGDGAVAKLYGLDADAVLRGLPLESYFERIQCEDKSLVAKAIHTAIVTGEPYSASFRIETENMRTVRVVACGRCFRNLLGEPSIFSGIVFPAASINSADTLLSQMVIAHRAAIDEGNLEIARSLDALVRKLAARRHEGGLYISH